MPGDPSVNFGRNSGGTKGAPKPSELLRDMRAVYRTESLADDTIGKKRCRELLEKDPKGFMLQLERQEKDMRSRSVAGKEKPAPLLPAPDIEGGSDMKGDMDKGTRRVVDLIDRLLDEWPPDNAAQNHPDQKNS